MSFAMINGKKYPIIGNRIGENRSNEKEEKREEKKGYTINGATLHSVKSRFARDTKIFRGKRKVW